MNPGQAMISRFGGQTALAEALHTKQSTVQYWAKIGNIPAKWHKPLIEAALRRGISVSSSDFSPAAIEPESRSLKAPEAKWPGLLPVAGDEVLYLPPGKPG